MGEVDEGVLLSEEGGHLRDAQSQLEGRRLLAEVQHLAESDGVNVLQGVNGQKQVKAEASKGELFEDRTDGEDARLGLRV